MMKILLTVIYLLFTTSGLVLMKMGGDSLKFSLAGTLSFKIGYLTFFGFCFYIVSFLLWQKLVVSFDLSYIVPIATAIVQVLSLLVGWIVFKENINFYNIAGIIVIIIGILLVSKR